MSVVFGPRRGSYIDISEEKYENKIRDVDKFESLDLVYRSLCALLFNYVPVSGHPGGSISAGRMLSALLFQTMDYDLSAPDRDDADYVSLAGGHKVLGLYAMSALRNEIARIGAPELLADDERHRFRLEDLLGFRRNPVTNTPLFRQFNVKPLDGHPTPATPFVRLSTGASGVGVGSTLGLAFGALDYFADDPPVIHVIDGEGGMTPGRVAEVLAAAGTSCLKNAVFHVDWNQASIDSNAVCRENDTIGEFVQWTPMELAYLHDWNVVFVPDGMDFQQVFAAQQKIGAMGNSQPTAIVYRTTKGWRYGIEGKNSHGAGHKLCSDGFYEALRPLAEATGIAPPKCEGREQRCDGGRNADIVEGCYWEVLTNIRTYLEGNRPLIDFFADRLRTSRQRLEARARKPRKGAPNMDRVFQASRKDAATIPAELTLEPGTSTTLRGELGRVLEYLNRESDGALLSGSADLLGSTSVATAAKGFPPGYFNGETNRGARLLSVGGICEDGMSGILSGISTFGRHMGVGSSYGAFIAALSHVSARLHAIGNQMRQAVAETPYRPMMIICGHAGVKTGEDGPTHADPQCLQLFQDNFPRRTMITLTPWDPQDLWTLVSAALNQGPAVIAPYVTRPNETVLDRKALGLAPATDSASGVYLLRRARNGADGAVVLQGSEVAYAFILDTMPLLEKAGIDVDAYYVASAELFDLLEPAEQERIFPESVARQALGITGFTLPTLYRWVRSERGRAMSLHPFRKGHFLGSGQGDRVMEEAGLDGPGQFEAIVRYLEKPGR
jgi:transketolase